MQQEKQITIDLNELRKRKLFVATPMYGGMCSGFYHTSTLDLSTLCNKHNIEMKYFAIFNESLITRARNYCVDEFLRSDSTHLMFIDSDIHYDANDVLALLAIADPISDKDIVCGPYPKKNISWEKVKEAVDKGYADENPMVLERFAGDFVFNPIGGEFRLDEPTPVLEGGTGFMIIQRKVFEKLAEDHSDWLYRPDHVRSKNFDGGREIYFYFQDPIDPKSRRQLSEDYFFCQQALASGLKVWMCPWMKIHHIGTYRFVGDMPAVATIGASLTADMEKISKMKR